MRARFSWGKEPNIRDKVLRLSVIIPCYNEMATLQRCIAKVISIARDDLAVEVIVVDDCSTDSSLSIANRLASQHQGIRVLQHSKNLGKGAAIKSGLADIVASE